MELNGSQDTEENGSDKARSRKGMFRLRRFTHLFPSDYRPIYRTAAWMREWARNEDMSPQTLYRAERDMKEGKYLRTAKLRIPDEKGETRLRKWWIFLPTHAFAELGRDRYEAMSERLVSNGGVFSYQEAGEELERIGEYLLDLIDALSNPELDITDADYLYDPGIGALWHWVGEI